MFWSRFGIRKCPNWKKNEKENAAKINLQEQDLHQQRDENMHIKNNMKQMRQQQLPDRFYDEFLQFKKQMGERLDALDSRVTSYAVTDQNVKPKSTRKTTKKRKKRSGKETKSQQFSRSSESSSESSESESDGKIPYHAICSEDVTTSKKDILR